MFMELRYAERRKLSGVQRVVRGLVVTKFTPAESQVVGAVFGNAVDADGQCGVPLRCTARLADGYGGHYIYIEVPEDEPAPIDWGRWASDFEHWLTGYTGQRQVLLRDITDTGVVYNDTGTQLAWDAWCSARVVGWAEGKGGGP